eukprot:Sdes_comp19617_c0_seq3m11366
MHFIHSFLTPQIFDLLKNNSCELCWYFPHTWEQYRISGKMFLLVSNHNFAVQNHKSFTDPNIYEETGYFFDKICENYRCTVETLRKDVWMKLSEKTKKSFMRQEKKSGYEIPDSFALLFLLPFKVQRLDLKASSDTFASTNFIKTKSLSQIDSFHSCALWKII